MEQEDPNSSIANNVDDDDAQFHEESPFIDAWESFHSDHSLCFSKYSSFSDDDSIDVTSSIQSKETAESLSSSFFDDFDRQLLVSQQSSNEISPFYSFSKTDRFVDFDPRGSTLSAVNDCKISHSMKDNERSTGTSNFNRIRASSNRVRKLLNEDNNDHSAITSVNDDARINDESSTADSFFAGSNFIFSLAGLVIRMIGFQLNLLYNSATFPIRLFYYAYLLVTDPFRITRLAKYYVLGNILRLIDRVKQIMYTWVRKQESTWKLCIQIGWALLWSVYVGFILLSLLVFALVISGIIMKHITEKPIHITEQLHFDYTKDSPTAFVPLTSCPDPSVLECSELIMPGCTAEARVIPLDHKVHVTVSLTLPESHYNRNLGMFQVRVDFLSGNGTHLASSRQPCMLHFKSQPIRLMLIFLKLAPLITGYSSESQKIDIKFRGYSERNTPTSCLRVTLEQRAEFTRGGGVPEIYEASLKLESRPPFFKRILWSWKGTIYIWITIMMFLVELLFTLICCTPIIMPWLRIRGVSSYNNGFQNTLAGPK